MTHKYKPGDRVRLARPSRMDMMEPDPLRQDEILVITVTHGMVAGDPEYYFVREDGSVIVSGTYPIYESQLEPE